MSTNEQEKEKEKARIENADREISELVRTKNATWLDREHEKNENIYTVPNNIQLQNHMAAIDEWVAKNRNTDNMPKTGNWVEDYKDEIHNRYDEGDDEDEPFNFDENRDSLYGRDDGPSQPLVQQNYFSAQMKILFDSFFIFTEQKPNVTVNYPTNISKTDLISLTPDKYAAYIVNQKDPNENTGSLIKYFPLAATARELSLKGDSVVNTASNFYQTTKKKYNIHDVDLKPKADVSSTKEEFNKMQKFYNSIPSYKTLADFYVKKLTFDRIQPIFFNLVSKCQNIGTITTVDTLQQRIKSLIPDTLDASTFTEKINPLYTFMISLLECMNTNTSASGGPPSGAIVAAQQTTANKKKDEKIGKFVYENIKQIAEERDAVVRANNFTVLQSNIKRILNLDPNLNSKLKTFVYKYLALVICYIVTNTNSSDNTTVTSIPPERWAFILPYIAEETTKQGPNQQQKTLLQTFVNNNSLSEIISAAQYPGDPDIKKIQLINKTIDSVVRKIDAKIASINNRTASTGLSLMKTRVLNECNALRRSIEYNKVKGIYTANVDVTNKLAALLIYFASYYSKEDYKVGRNGAYYPRYLVSVLNSIQNNNAPSNISIPNRDTYNYITNISWFCEHYQDGNFNDQIQLFFDIDAEKYRSQNSNGKTITTPTTLTIVTVDSRGNKKSTCLASDMYPPDTKFNPIATIMKQKAVAMNLETQAKALYDQILEDRRECKATVTSLYSKTFSSLTSTKWEKLGGRRTRRRIIQKNQKKQKKAYKMTQKRRKFRTRKQRKQRK